MIPRIWEGDTGGSALEIGPSPRRGEPSWPAGWTQRNLRRKLDENILGNLSIKRFDCESRHVKSIKSLDIEEPRNHEDTRHRLLPKAARNASFWMT